MIKKPFYLICHALSLDLQLLQLCFWNLRTRCLFSRISRHAVNRQYFRRFILYGSQNERKCICIGKVSCLKTSSNNTTSELARFIVQGQNYLKKYFCYKIKSISSTIGKTLLWSYILENELTNFFNKIVLN